MEVTPVQIGSNNDDEQVSEPVSESDKVTAVEEVSQVEIASANSEDSPTEELRIHDEVVEESDADYDPDQSVALSPEVNIGNNEHLSDSEAVNEVLNKEETSTHEIQNHQQDEDEEDDYDPEETLRIPKKEFSDSIANKGIEPENNDDDDDYEPIVSVTPPQGDSTTSSNSILKGKAPPIGLPPKPQLNAAPSVPVSDVNDMASRQLNEAYETIMKSDLVKDPEFVKLPAQEQMRQIMEKLEESNVELNPNILNNPNINYNQVYSFNKPFKNLKNPIPLIPVNEFCRRPNITAPMTREEEDAYQEFIKTESYYMKTQKWDEFPDKLRLFIGNLPANTISKQDLFRIFSQYGEVVQISIKAGFGFAQFRTAEQCLACIKGESDVPLHNKIMRLDASKPQTAKSNREKRGDRGGRERERDSSSDGRSSSDFSESSKRRKVVPDCYVYITGKSSVFFIRKVKKTLASARISVETEDVTHNDVSEVVQEAAYSGVLGVCIIKDMKVDLQTFQETPDGGVKFDEYAEIEPEVAVDILMKVKEAKYGSLYVPQQDLPQIPHQKQPYPYNSGSEPYSDVSSQGYDLYGGAGSRRSGNSGNRSDTHRSGRNRKRERRQHGYDQHTPMRGAQQPFSGQQWSSNQPQQMFYGNSGYGNSNSGPQGYGGYNNNNNNGTNNQFGQQQYGHPPQLQYGSGSYGNGNFANGPYSTSTGSNNDYNLYGGGREPQQQDTNALLNTLKNIDPQSMQSMINMLQLQLQLQPQQQRGMPSPQLFGGQYGQSQPPANNQVSSLLSQLKSAKPPGSTHNGSNQGDPTLSLMETLARLSKKW